MSRALVLGGGGITGVAWEVGLLFGLQQQGVDLTNAARMVGTSAGAVVAAQVSGGAALADLYAKQASPPSGARGAGLSKATLLRYGWALFRAKSQQDFGARMGRLALAAKTETEAERRVAFRALLGEDPPWPAADLKVTALHSSTGELRVFDRNSGAALLDAVGASAAVPGVWPPVTIQGQRYIDGGMTSGTHANLAEGHDRIVIVAPLTFGARVMTSPFVHAEALKAKGAKVALVVPDAAAKKELGGDALDPRRRAHAARAGLAQAERVRADVAAVWG